MDQCVAFFVKPAQTNHIARAEGGEIRALCEAIKLFFTAVLLLCSVDNLFGASQVRKSNPTIGRDGKRKRAL